MGVGGDRHCSSRGVLCELVAVSIFATCLSAHAAPLPQSAQLCATARCGMVTDGAYKNYVIGRLTHVGSATDMKQVYHWAKTHGYWKHLPNSLAPYLKDVKLVTITLPPALASHPVTVFMQQEEYASAPYVVGDLVRYSPHGSDHEVPRGNADDIALYHGLTGCVATLCRQSDPACYKRYRQGVFTKMQGEQVSLQTGKIIPDGLHIDPISLLPVK
jgi:hypothetical protein